MRSALRVVGAGPGNSLLWAASIVVLVSAAHTPVSRADAQARVSVSGIITDSNGAPISGATVSVGGVTTVSDDGGRFRIAAVSGTITVSVRRLGFTPTSASVNATAGQQVRDLRISMPAAPGLLNPVVVSARRSDYTGRLAGYYKRLERRSGGYFITRDEIDRKSYKNLSQLLRAVPGINAFPLITGGSAVRMRERKCRPLVFIDGVPMPAGEVDLDAFPVSTLHGIEAYPGSANTPQDFVANGDQACGTIVLWSRGRDTDPVSPQAREPANIEKLLDSHEVFTADEVDERARLVDSAALDVMYPPELMAQRRSGTVVVQFVVDVSGAIEKETISVVSSSHPLMSAAALLALKGVSYHSASKAGKAVRQVILQPFEFTPGGERATQGVRPTIKQGG